MGRISRRDLLRFGGGSALGLLFTPAPWKLIADSAVWTQNWAGIAKLSRGPVEIRQTACTLCPVGCAAKVRCVADAPIGMSGVQGDPLSRGALCPAAFSGHQLPWHPARVRSPRTREGAPGEGRFTEVSLDAAVALAAGALARRGPGETVVVLDDRPGRVRSEAYRSFVKAVDGGVYVPSPSRSSRPLDLLTSLHEPMSGGRLTLHPDRARTILTFGAPLLDGYGGPGTAGALLRSRRETGHPQILAVEPRLSRTAALADRWLAIRPGTEAILALGLAHQLLREGLVDVSALRQRAMDFESSTLSGGAGAPNGAIDYRGLVSRFTAEKVAECTGVEPASIVDLARRLADGPTLVLGSDPSTGPLSPAEETAIWGLNLLLNAGREDGVLGVGSGVPQAASGGPPVRELESLPDGSARLILLDATGPGGILSYAALRDKLAPGGLLVSLSPWDLGLSRYADVIVPAPAPIEMVEEAATAPLLGPAAYRVAMPLLEAPAGATDPAEFVRRVAEAAGRPLTGAAGSDALLDSMKRRVEGMHARGRGRVIRMPDGSSSPVAEIVTAGEVWDVLAAGGLWVDEVSSRTTERFRLLGTAPEKISSALILMLEAAGSPELVVTCCGWSACGGPAAAAPLLTKLGQESGLREGSPEALMAPVTAERLGLEAGRPIRILTENGAVVVRLRPSAGVRPGVVHLALGPGYRGLDEESPAVADLFRIGDPSARRALPARIEEA